MGGQAGSPGARRRDRDRAPNGIMTHPATAVSRALPLPDYGWAVSRDCPWRAWAGDLCGTHHMTLAEPDHACLQASDLAQVVGGDQDRDAVVVELLEEVDDVIG